MPTLIDCHYQIGATLKQICFFITRKTRGKDVLTASLATGPFIGQPEQSERCSSAKPFRPTLKQLAGMSELLASYSLYLATDTEKQFPVGSAT